jgi:adenylate cyclase
VLEVVRSYFGIAERDDEPTARGKVEGRLSLIEESSGETLALLLDFLGVADPKHTLPQLDPEARQRRLFAAFNLIAQVRSRHRPGVVLVENLQWLDPGSEAFLENVVEGLPGGRLMLLMNFRPEYQAQWLPTSRWRHLPLSPLGPEAIDLLLEDMLGADSSLEGLAARVRERTAGNPFFIEEVVRTLAEAGTLAGSKGDYRLVHPAGVVTIPRTVQAVLAARIDRLGEREKAVLQTAAVIGAQFSEPVLRRVTGLREPELASVLQALVAAEFVCERALYPGAEYAFTHALTEEVAYGSQLGSRRAEVHGAVAGAIEELYPDRLDERAALLAEHWEAAGETASAAHWSGRAAVWARLKDPLEAMRHWHKVLELARPLEETADTVGLRIAAGWMILNLGCRLGITEGQAAGDFEREMAQVYADSRALAERHEQIGGLAVLASVYAAVLTLSGHLEVSAEHGREAIELARRTGDPALHVAVLPPPVYALFVGGDLREALAATEEGLRLAGTERELGSSAAIVSPYAWLLLMRGLLQGWTGSLVSGKRALAQALEIARQDQDQETEAFTHMMLVMLAELGGAPEGVLEHARQGVEIAERSGGAFWQGIAHQSLGIARVLRGEWEEALAALEHALSIYRDRNVGLEAEPMSVAFLARAYLGRNDAQAALDTAEKAIELACARGTKGWELYARHHRAQALLAQDDDRAAGEELERTLALVAITGAQAFGPRLRRDLEAIRQRRGSIPLA